MVVAILESAPLPTTSFHLVMHTPDAQMYTRYFKNDNDDPDERNVSFFTRTRKLPRFALEWKQFDAKDKNGMRRAQVFNGETGQYIRRLYWRVDLPALVAVHSSTGKVLTDIELVWRPDISEKVIMTTHVALPGDSTIRRTIHCASDEVLEKLSCKVPEICPQTKSDNFFAPPQDKFGAYANETLTFFKPFYSNFLCRQRRATCPWLVGAIVNNDITQLLQQSVHNEWMIICCSNDFTQYGKQVLLTSCNLPPPICCLIFTYALQYFSVQDIKLSACATIEFDIMDGT